MQHGMGKDSPNNYKCKPSSTLLLEKELPNTTGLQTI
jgi:hypothetical protein